MRSARVLRPHAIIGEEALIANRPSRLGTICLTHVMTLSISKESYTKVLLEFPDMTKIIRRNVLRDNVRAGVRTPCSHVEPCCTAV